MFCFPLDSFRQSDCKQIIEYSISICITTACSPDGHRGDSGRDLHLSAEGWLWELAVPLLLHGAVAARCGGYGVVQGTRTLQCSHLPINVDVHSIFNTHCVFHCLNLADPLLIPSTPQYSNLEFKILLRISNVGELLRTLRKLQK